MVEYRGRYAPCCGGDIMGNMDYLGSKDLMKCGRGHVFCYVCRRKDNPHNEWQCPRCPNEASTFRHGSMRT